ncbi:MAG: HDOD domain-containing protein [Deltaproteobacteria bacterium]|nr:HDOD domain-containing protein [Deltaproteobacteria bacterium]
MQFSKSVERVIAFTVENASTTAERAAQSLAAKLVQVEGLKTFPVVAQKTMAILSDPDFEIAEVSRIVSEDPALGARVMRVANSAFYSRGMKVASFEQAVVRLGRIAVREVVAGAATMGLFPDSTGIGKAFRDHCAATASVAKTLARDLAPALEDGAFLTGLLHDIGKLLILSAGDPLYGRQDAAMLLTPDRTHLIELDELGFDHAALAGQILWHWQIPDPVPQIVAWHHQPALAYTEPVVDVVTAFLRIADHVEPMLAANEEHALSFIDLFAAGPDCRFTGVSADDLRRAWPQMIAARDESLSLFGENVARA